MAPALIVLLTVLAQQPTYVVASVKLDSSGPGHSSSNGSKGQIVITNQSLKSLVERAYNVKPLQVLCPGWMDDVRVDITAKYPPDTKPEDRALMLRALLEERFKLSAHTASKEMQGYSLVVAKGGFKLKTVEPGGPGTSSNGGNVRTLKATKLSMAQLADFVARETEEMVVDNTAIEGVFDFELRWAHDTQTPDTPATETAPSIFTAIQETLGLRLKPEKIPVEIIVVDHMERVPTEN
jgi:uncharacterized protein (TIGR03435 family)